MKNRNLFLITFTLLVSGTFLILIFMKNKLERSSNEISNIDFESTENQNQDKNQINIEEQKQQNLNIENENLLQLITDYDSSNNHVEIVWDDDYFYINGDGLPNHSTGSFPNPHNPNTISEQNVSLKVTKNPEYLSTIIDVKIPGVTLGGIVFDPGTAEKDPETGWSIEAIQDMLDLGLDFNNAHVQPNGKYHYHGAPDILNTNELNEHSALIGFAADGFPFYILYGYSNPEDTTSEIKEMKSSWQIKSGKRVDGPKGIYDGTYTNDFEFVEGSGDLTECNAKFTVTPEYPDGTYAYFITSEFPYIPRCVHGAPDPSFLNIVDERNMEGAIQPLTLPDREAQIPMCSQIQKTKCCGDGICGGPETIGNCSVDCS